MNLVDSSGWIEYFFAGPNAEEFAPVVEDSANLGTSVICVYEVFKKVFSVTEEADALRAVAQMRAGAVYGVSEEIALKASVISLNSKLPMADSLIYATALLHRGKVWTQDADFEGLPDVKYIAHPERSE